MADEPTSAASDGTPPAPDPSAMVNDGLATALLADAKSHTARRVMLLAAGALVVAVSVAAVFWPEADETAPPPSPPAAPAKAAIDQIPDQPGPKPPTGVSLSVAEKARAEGDSAAALDCYRQLLATTRSEAGEEDADLVVDFLVLRLAQAQLRSGHSAEARTELASLAKSRSPVIRGMVSFQTALLDLREGRYLTARMQAYKALAVLTLVPGTGSIQSACDVLVAESLSRKALTLFNRERDLPATAGIDLDPFSNLRNEEELRGLLAAGTHELAGAILAPKLAVVANARTGPRWTVTSAGAPVEELLNRLAGAAGIEIAWQGPDAAARARPLFLYGENLTDQRVIEVACGAVGLLARLSGTRAVIHDPATCASTSDLQDILVREAGSAWRRLFLLTSEAGQFAYGHFALGLLCECRNDKPGAMTEFDLLAERFPHSPLAPLARLRSAATRIDLTDYAGARDELLELLNRHPDFSATDEVYLRLGKATMEAGLYDEAVATFKKLYGLELSGPSRLGACLGAGTCLYRKGDYAGAAEWLNRYLSLAADQTGDEPAQAALLLGRSEGARGRLDEARTALRTGLGFKPGPAFRTDILLELARTLVKQDELAAAVTVVEGLDRSTTSPEKADEAILLRAEILRTIGLAEKAKSLLKAELGSAASPEGRTRMVLELARCHVDLGELEEARRRLSAVFTEAGTGPLAGEAACELADVCLKAGQASHAASVCRHLLTLPLSDDLRRRVFEVLGTAYLRMRDYDRASLALSGVLPPAEGAATP